MPRYEIRNTSDSGLTYVEGDLPLNLMLSQAAGTYRARVMSAEQATDIVVPSLTASITQASLTVGQTATLTTNAPAGSTYQWRLGGSPIGGATSASYVTAAAGTLTCQVSTGPQSVTTAGVTVSAAPSGVTITYERTFAWADGTGTFPTRTFASAVTGAGRYLVACYMGIGANFTFQSATLAGAACAVPTANSRFAAVPNVGGVNTDHLVVFEATTTGAGDLTITFGTTSPNRGRVFIIRLDGAGALVDTLGGAANYASAPWTQDRNVETVTNGAVLAFSVTSNLVDWDAIAGFTVRQSQAAGLGTGVLMFGDAVDVAAATPRTMTFGDTNQAAGVTRTLSLSFAPA